MDPTAWGGATRLDGFPTCSANDDCEVKCAITILIHGVKINIDPDRDEVWWDYDGALAHELDHIYAFISRMKFLAEQAEPWPDKFDSVEEAEEKAIEYIKKLEKLIKEQKAKEIDHDQKGDHGTPPEGRPTDWNDPENLPRP